MLSLFLFLNGSELQKKQLLIITPLHAPQAACCEIIQRATSIIDYDLRDHDADSVSMSRVCPVLRDLYKAPESKSATWYNFISMFLSFELQKSNPGICCIKHVCQTYFELRKRFVHESLLGMACGWMSKSALAVLGVKGITLTWKWNPGFRLWTGMENCGSYWDWGRNSTHWHLVSHFWRTSGPNTKWCMVRMKYTGWPKMVLLAWGLRYPSWFMEMRELLTKKMAV